MITVNISESFIITVALLNESTGALASGETVYYDIRTVNDTPLSPPINGTLTESTVEAGIYKVSLSIPVGGNYICYASAEDTDFASSTEEIIVNTENIYDLTNEIITNTENIYALSTTISGQSAEIITNTENIYTVTKNNYHYNISIENVLRVNETPTASQITRNVPLNKTDYVITRVKNNDDSDWTSPDASGIVYAHYEALSDTVPYKMGGPL